MKDTSVTITYCMISYARAVDKTGEKGIEAGNTAVEQDLAIATEAILTELRVGSLDSSGDFTPYPASLPRESRDVEKARLGDSK